MVRRGPEHQTTNFNDQFQSLLHHTPPQDPPEPASILQAVQPTSIRHQAPSSAFQQPTATESDVYLFFGTSGLNTEQAATEMGPSSRPSSRPSSSKSTRSFGDHLASSAPFSLSNFAKPANTRNKARKGWRHLESADFEKSDPAPPEPQSPIDDEKSAYHQVLVKVFNGIPSEPNILSDNSGIFEGQVCFTLNPNGDVQAHQWQLNSWVNIGQFSCLRHRVEGQLEKDLLRGQKISDTLAPNTLEYFRALAEQRQTDYALTHPTFLYAPVLPGNVQRPQLHLDTAHGSLASSNSSTADTIMGITTGGVVRTAPQVSAHVVSGESATMTEEPTETWMGFPTNLKIPDIPSESEITSDIRHLIVPEPTMDPSLIAFAPPPMHARQPHFLSQMPHEQQALLDAKRTESREAETANLSSGITEAGRMNASVSWTAPPAHARAIRHSKRSSNPIDLTLTQAPLLGSQAQQTIVCEAVARSLSEKNRKTNMPFDNPNWFSHRTSAYAKKHNEDIAEKIWNSGLKDRLRQEDALKFIAKVQGTPIQPIEHALRPVLENLKSYAEETAGRKLRDYFTRHYAAPPVWCVDRTAAGEKSFFGEDYGVPPARVGRDMRYNPPTPIGFEHHLLRSGNIHQPPGVAASCNPFASTCF